MTSKGKKNNLRQRKQPPKDKPTNAANKEDDDDWALLEAASQQGRRRIPSLAVLIGLGVLVMVAAMYFVGHGKDITDKSGAQSESAQEQQDQDQRRAQEAKEKEEEKEDDGAPVVRPIPFAGALVTLPHETTAYTQGLCFRPNNSSVVYESTGMYKESELRIVDLSNGNVLKRQRLPEHYFAEGLTYFEDHNATTSPHRLVLLTWKEQTGFVHDADTLEVLEEFSYQTTTSEGWGIIYNPRDDNFIVSDGSEYLHFWDRNFQETSKIQVRYKTHQMKSQNLPATPLKWLNELEWDDRTGMILANVYFQDLVVAIDPDTGFVTTMYDMKDLYTNRSDNADVFNGIALSPNGQVWVTGKYWPHLYQVDLPE